MNIHEIDWRYSSIKEILNAISSALVEIKDHVEDVDEASEESESFLGVAFVAAQTYITRTVADAQRLANAASDAEKKDLLKDYSDVLSGTGVTEMQLCDSIANYFKHHDEWLDWTPNSKKKAIYALNGVGITEMTTYPCQEAAKIMWGFGSSDLEPLLSMLSEWRKKVVAGFK